MSVQVARFKPPGVPRVDEYDLDAFAVEYEPDSDAVDFRLELGQGLGIYWALPAAPDERLRLVLVDGAAFEVDEPLLTLDPWCCELPAFEWRGELLRLPRNRTLVAVRFEAALRPARYRCEFSVLSEDGHDELIVRQWTRRLEPGLAGLRSWARLAVRFGRLPQGEREELEAAAGALSASGELDGDGQGAVAALATVLREAAAAAVVRSAAQACLTALGEGGG